MRIRRASKGKPSGGDCIGFDVVTAKGRRVGVVEDVYRCSKRKVGTCLLLARRIPGRGLAHFLLPLRQLAFDPVQYCFVWNHERA